MHDTETKVEIEILQSDDDSHVVIAYPWFADPGELRSVIETAKKMGFTEMTSEGNLDGYTSQGCDDWDYIRVEPPRA